MAYSRKAGQRVYMLLVHEKTGEEKRRAGTVESDEIEFWDYTTVRFDDFPALAQTVLGYYLFDEETPNDEA